MDDKVPESAKSKHIMAAGLKLFQKWTCTRRWELKIRKYYKIFSEEKKQQKKTGFCLRFNLNICAMSSLINSYLFVSFSFFIILLFIKFTLANKNHSLLIAHSFQSTLAANKVENYICLLKRYVALLLLPFQSSYKTKEPNLFYKWLKPCSILNLAIISVQVWFFSH